MVPQDYEARKVSEDPEETWVCLALLEPREPKDRQGRRRAQIKELLVRPGLTGEMDCVV